MNLVALLKARSHSQDVAWQANISKDRRWRIGECFFYILLTSPGYRNKFLSSGDNRAGCRIPAEFVGDSVLLFPAGIATL
jgi:hypothetical protein